MFIPILPKSHLLFLQRALCRMYFVCVGRYFYFRKVQRMAETKTTNKERLREITAGSRTVSSSFLRASGIMQYLRTIAVS